MPKVAILSDIHANLPALTAVLEDAAKSGATEIYCGGDTVGYAAQSDECVSLLRQHGIPSVLGNHDYYTNAVLGNPDNIPAGEGWRTNAVWAGVIHAMRTLGEENARWLAGLPRILDVPGGLLTHAALHFPDEWPYLHSFGDASPTLDILEKSEHGIGFFGHTHQQTFFTHRNGSVMAKRLDFSHVMIPEGVVCAVMVGSVGQPRDADHRAAWVLWDSDTRVVEFHRTAYPALEAAQQVIDAGLPESSALRLLDVAERGKLRSWPFRGKKLIGSLSACGPPIPPRI